jgi:hypothetical protein
MRVWPCSWNGFSPAGGASLSVCPGSAGRTRWTLTLHASTKGLGREGLVCIYPARKTFNQNRCCRLLPDSPSHFAPKGGSRPAHGQHQWRRPQLRPVRSRALVTQSSNPRAQPADLRRGLHASCATSGKLFSSLHPAARALACGDKVWGCGDRGSSVVLGKRYI